MEVLLMAELGQRKFKIAQGELREDIHWGKKCGANKAPLPKRLPTEREEYLSVGKPFEGDRYSHMAEFKVRNVVVFRIYERR